MTRIYTQIEEAADLYSPSVYALLPLFRDFQKEADPTSADFMPLTATKLTSESGALADRHKIFVIGIIPPTVEVTGRYLDRGTNLGGSAGDAAATNAASAANPSSTPSTVVSPSGSDCTATVLEGQMAGTQTDASHLEFMAGPDDYIDGKLNPFTEAYYLQKGDTQSLKALLGTGGHGRTHCCQTALAAMRKCGIQDASFNRSQTSYEILKDGRMSTNVDNRYGTCSWIDVAKKNDAWVSGANESNFPVRGSAVVAQRVGGVNPLTGKEIILGQHAFTVTQSDGKASTASCDGGGFQAHVYKANQLWTFRDGSWYAHDLQANVVRKVSGWTDPAKMLESASNTVTPDADPGNFKEDGSDAAKDAANKIDSEADKDARPDSPGEKYQAEQKRMIDATREALDRIRNTPPLKLLVNPISFKVGSEKIISDGNRSRSHHIVEHWGEQQDKIEGSGKLAGFYSIDFAGTSGGPGLTRTARQYSASYQNFLSLFQLYKNNGGLWLQDFFDARMDPEARNLSVLGSLYIYYDNIIYFGSFDTLTMSEADTAPYTLEYSFTFTVRAAFLLDRELENPKQDYGMAGLFPQAMPTSSGATPTEATAGANPELDAINQAHAESMAEDARQQLEEAEQAAAWKEGFSEVDAVIRPAPSEPSEGNNAITKGKGGKSKSVVR